MIYLGLGALLLIPGAAWFAYLCETAPLDPRTDDLDLYWTDFDAWEREVAK